MLAAASVGARVPNLQNVCRAGRGARARLDVIHRETHPAFEFDFEGFVPQASCADCDRVCCNNLFSQDKSYPCGGLVLL